MDTIPFPQLQSFLAVARAKSFSGGARELGVSRAAVSQGVRQLEESLGVVLLARTTRSVSLTDAGQRLLELAGPAFAQTRAALDEVAAKPGEVVGRVRLSVPRSAFSFVIEPVLPAFRERHPRIQIELVFEDRRVDIVSEGFDAGVRLSEFVERDMVSVRLTDAFRFVIVGAPSYLEKHGTPQRPEDLLHHECLTFRSDTTGSLYAWELERGRRTWRIPVRGSVVSSDGLFCFKWAEQGLGLAYAFEPLVADQLRAGRLRRVLEPYAPSVPGFFLYYPSRAQRSEPLRLFIETVRERAARAMARTGLTIGLCEEPRGDASSRRDTVAAMVASKGRKPATPRKPAAKKATQKKTVLSKSTEALDAKKLKKLAREQAASAPARLLAQIDQLASMGAWITLPAVSTKSSWQPPGRFVVVNGGITATKVEVRDGVSDFGVVIVLGDIMCASLDVKSGWTLLCTGAVTAKGTIQAAASGSVTYVGGTVTAKLVKSGANAWLTLFGGAASLKAPVSSYVMVDGAGPLQRSK